MHIWAGAFDVLNRLLCRQLAREPKTGKVNMRKTHNKNKVPSKSIFLINALSLPYCGDVCFKLIMSCKLTPHRIYDLS